MTAVICYHAQFFVNKKDSLILSFAFGDDVSIRSVLILPTFLSIDATLNLPHDTHIFQKLISPSLCFWIHQGKNYRIGYFFIFVYHVIYLLIYHSLYIILIWMILLLKFPNVPPRMILLFNIMFSRQYLLKII